MTRWRLERTSWRDVDVSAEFQRRRTGTADEPARFRGQAGKRLTVQAHPPLAERRCAGRGHEGPDAAAEPRAEGRRRERAVLTREPGERGCLDSLVAEVVLGERLRPIDIP